jgi:hypothetical protein
MKPFKTILKVGAALVLLLGPFAGCGTTEEGSSSANGGVYYGSDFDDPWYDGAYYPPEVVVLPPGPGDVPPADSMLRPAHPIAEPPPAAVSSPRPMPTIPSAPRPSSRR